MYRQCLAYNYDVYYVRIIMTYIEIMEYLYMENIASILPYLSLNVCMYEGSYNT